MSPNPSRDDLPAQFPVAVLVSRERLHGNPWQVTRWRVTGVVAGEATAAAGPRRTLVRAEGDCAHYLERGFTIRLHRDEAESYYHNLMSEHPSAFVIGHPDEAGELRAALVTLSYDEAESYMRGEAEVHRVPMPPEIYRWLEAYVLEHYVPEQRAKRKRDAWKEGPERGRPG